MRKRTSRTSRIQIRRRVPALAGMLMGVAGLWLTVAAGSTAVAQRTQSDADAVFEATHLPPLLRLSGERPRLLYDVHCASEGVADPEQGCDVAGSVFVRAGTRGAFRALPLEPRRSAGGIRQLGATVPLDVATTPDGFEYYAELRAAGRAESLVVPAGGADAPHRSLLLQNSVTVTVGTHDFGATIDGTRIASARWGDGPADVGLEQGRGLPAIGVSSFDVGPDGTVVLLDEAHRRALRFDGGGPPTIVPISIAGRLADLTLGDDGSMYVLESVSTPARAPLVRHFDRTGRQLDVVETAERVPSQIRISPAGPLVLQHPSHQWMPVAEAGVPAAPRDQLRKGKVGRSLGAGREVVVLRDGQEIRAAVVSNGRVERSWRVMSDSPLAEVQLAEPVGHRLILVTRVFTDAADEFVVIVLDRDGLVHEFSTPADDWAEAAPLGRFRLAGNQLYRLGSDASGAFVDRYDLEAP